MKKFIIILCLLPIHAFAQMAQPSVFPEMRSVNPGLIALRKLGDIKASAQVNSIKKEMDMTDLSMKDKSKISLTDANFFRGGKGGGLTTELSVDYATGKKESKIESNNGLSYTFNTKTSSSYVNLALGAPGFGIGLTHVDYKSQFDFSFNMNGQAYSSSNTGKVTSNGAKPGIVIGGPNLALGITGEYNQIKFNNSSSTSGTQKQRIIGVALGGGGGNSIIELGVEVDPFVKLEPSPGTTTKPKMPMKVSFLAETKIGSLTLGYKGMGFMGQFIELDKIIPTQLVYSNSGDDLRLEHVFNFAFGGSSGLSFGGSASYGNSKTKEKSTTFAGSSKYDTKTTEMAVAVKIGYVY
jgi:hypothetical protein